MKKLRIYLDTSVISFLFADDAPEKRDVTREFFAHHIDEYDVLISDVVLVEINNTRDSRKRNQLKEAAGTFGLRTVELSERAQDATRELASYYIESGVIPASQWEDAMHVAIATVVGFDVLLSWNFRHLANVERQIKVNAANRARGYGKPLLIVTPMEVIHAREDE